MGSENQISGGDDESTPLGGDTVMNDRTSGRQGAGVRQSDQPGSGQAQRGGSPIDNDEESEQSEKETSSDPA